MDNNKPFTFVYSKLARDQIADTLNYIADTLCNPQAANKLFLKIDKTIEQICLFPYSNPEYKQLRDKAVRRALVDNYMLFYKISEENHTVYIVALYYAKMDLDELI